ncbi:hypothetical protein CQ018_01200 [Arthrobacter sp. MYb227]|uniref:HNH endonuclease signature motif containing protein n=1 Tax=Arthrobacter sp. MYb227 TaxID=1848601 RepID=UPI000CFC588A|nr:HNH endonuclease signature motif containing protein [Arthrobacter sp. MYb227]PQZ95940.1 hypothetical protein CQ018_01200 [Arthrobacter sp. MYb227]
MTTSASMIDAALAALNGALDTSPTPDGTAPIDPLRALATLNLLIRNVIACAEGSIGNSPVRAAAFARLSEQLAHAGSHSQIIAAGACDKTQVNTLTETALSGVNQTLSDLLSFANGQRQLPIDAVSAADRKPLYAGTAEFLASQFRIDFFQAGHRVNTHERLVPQVSDDGTHLPAMYPQLGTLLTEEQADPRAIASAAAKLKALDPAIEAQEDPSAVRTKLESLVVGTLLNAGPKTLDALIRRAATDLDRSALEREEDAIEHHLAIAFKGKRRQGYVWELTTDAIGHETLMSLADELNNPRTSSGKLRVRHDPGFGPEANTEITAGSPKISIPKASTPAIETVCGNENDCPDIDDDADADADATLPRDPSESSIRFTTTDEPDEFVGSTVAPFDDEFLPIPEWAANPSTPEKDRPRAAFNDVGHALPHSSEEDPLPGENAKQTNARLRARRLYQFVFDAIMTTLDPQAPVDVWMPMNSRIDLLVTITYDALAGFTEEAGYTQHGEFISAATARRMACNAGILPLVMGSKSQPLDLGRKVRYFTKAQKRAIAARDRGCANPGCSMPVHRTEVHHIKPFSENGKTDVSNGLLLCIRCHTAYHAGHFEVVVISQIPHVVLPASRDPLRLPRRNWVFHPEAAAA